MKDKLEQCLDAMIHGSASVKDKLESMPVRDDANFNTQLLSSLAQLIEPPTQLPEILRANAIRVYNDAW